MKTNKLNKVIPGVVGEKKAIEKETECPHCGCKEIDIAVRISDCSQHYCCFGCGYGWSFTVLTDKDKSYNQSKDEIAEREVYCDVEAIRIANCINYTGRPCKECEEYEGCTYRCKQIAEEILKGNVLKVKGQPNE